MPGDVSPSGRDDDDDEHAIVRFGRGEPYSVTDRVCSCSI
jgi:hypothetical protein